MGAIVLGDFVIFGPLRTAGCFVSLCGTRQIFGGHYSVATPKHIARTTISVLFLQFSFCEYKSLSLPTQDLIAR